LENEIHTTQIKQLIAQNKTQQVFDELNAAAFTKSDTAFQNNLILLEARWKKLKEDRTKGILSTENQELATNKIHNDLLALLDGMGKTKTTTPDDASVPKVAATEKVKKTSWKSILTILAATIAVLAGIAEVSGYSLRDWWEQKPSIENNNDLSQKPSDTGSPIATIPAAPTQTDTSGQSSTTDKPKEAVKEELPKAKAKLQVQIRTQKGQQDLVFKESEEVHLFFKVNRPCKLRTIYRLADGLLILLDNDRIVNTAETNKWVQLSDGFEVAAPFGVEELYLFAQEKNFPTLQTEEKDGYTIIKDELPTALSKTRGLKKKQVFAEDKLNITTQKNH